MVLVGWRSHTRFTHKTKCSEYPFATSRQIISTPGTASTTYASISKSRSDVPADTQTYGSVSGLAAANATHCSIE